MTDTWLEAVGLGLKLWEGVFEGKRDTWLRWCNQAGDIISTGAERAEQEYQRAEQAESLLEQERRRAEQLAAQLRALGMDPDRLQQE